MKKTSLIIFWSIIAGGITYAGVQAMPSSAAVSLPQPCTIFICTTGLAFFHYITKSKRIP